MKCRFCSFENEAGSTRCDKCGAWLDQQQAPSPPAEPTSWLPPSGSETPAPSGTDAPTPPPSNIDAALLDLLRAGHKIQAVKLYRAHTGEGLYEAKTAVEKLAREHGIESATSKGGCGSAVLLLLVVIAGFYYFIAA